MGRHPKMDGLQWMIWGTPILGNHHLIYCSCPDLSQLTKTKGSAGCHCATHIRLTCIF